MSEAAEIARKALSRGDLIGAYDATVAAMEAGDDSGAIRHQQILALARMGDTERAMDLFAAYGLDRSTDPHERAIGARLLKDRALAAPPGEGRQRALAKAHDAYHAIYLESGDSFPGINAATLALLAGDAAQSEALARALLDDPAVAAAQDYYKAATRAEALLLLGRTTEVTETLASETIRGSGDYGGRSTTMRQLAMIAAHLGMDEPARAALLAPLAPAQAGSQDLLAQSCKAEIERVEARIAQARKLPEYSSEHGRRTLASADRWLHHARQHAIKGETRNCVSAARKGQAQL